MATITGLTADRMQQIIDKTIVSANIVGGHLILTLSDGSTVDAGVAQGPAGPSGIAKVTAFPTVPAPTDGDMVIRIDMAGDPVYKYTTGNGWVLLAGGLAKVTAFPATPADGDGVVRTDLNGSPIFMYSTENGWEQLPRMGAVTVPAVKAKLSADQSIPTGVDTRLTWGAEDYDTNTMHDLVTNNGRLTCVTPGVYTLRCGIAFAAGAGTIRRLVIAKNGWGSTADQVAYVTSPASATRLEAVATMKMAAGDYVEAFCFQDTGAGLNVLSAQGETAFSATWLGGAGQTVDERGVPAVRATVAGGTQAVVGNAVIAYPTEDYDTDGMHDTAVNTSRLTIKTPGLYHVEGFVEVSVPPDTAGSAVNIFKNGALAGPDPYYLGVTATTNGRMSVQGVLLLAAGDYLELQFVNGATSSRTISRSSFSAVLIGSGKTVTPFARVSKSANQSFANGVQAVISWDTETSDNNSIHDTVTNNSRLTAFTAGVYAITGWVTWGVNGSGQRNIWIRKNGSATLSTLSSPAVSTDADYTRQEVMTLVELAVGDYVEMLGYQTSGAAINVNNGDASSGFAMVKVGAPIAGQTGIEIVEGWHSVGAAGEPAFQNAATAVAANPPKFYKDPKGVVRLTGIANSPGANTTIFQLPVGYRPLTDQYKIGCQPNNQAAVMTWVGSDGTVKTMGAVGNQIDLSVHTFRADQ